MIGETLGQYEITEQLGRGGMGEVWKARDQKLGRDVAIKTLPKEFGQDPQRLERFQREAKLLASLNHPNIAAIYGLEEFEGTRFLVLEFVDGETLAERLRHGPLPLEESLGIATQLVEALESAHEKGVVHRDLKPGNIKLTSEGKVKVLDFGLAKALAGDTEAVQADVATISMAATLQGSIIGTPGYMSPEQARGEATDKRTDIWSFGCVLFEMLTGQVTFGGRTVTDALAGVIAREPEWALLPPSIHPRLRLLLERCLQKDPRNRYHDIGDVRVDIEAVRSDPKGMRARGGAVGTAGGSAWLGWAVAGVSAAIAIGVLAWALGRPAPSEAVYRYVASAYPSLPLDLPGDLDTVTAVAISPDGTRVAYPVVIDNELTIYIRDVAQLEGSRFRPAGTIGAAPFFSPDGTSLGFLDPRDRTIRRATLTGSESPQAIYTYPQGTFPVGASWETQESIVFALTNDGRGLLELPALGGEVTELTTPAEGEEHYWPEVLPGGRAVLFAVGSGAGSSRIAVLDRDTGSVHTVVESGSEARYLEEGILVFNDGGTLRAIGFDPDTLQARGDPVPVLENVEWQSSTGAAQFAVSRNGNLVYINGRPVGDPMRRTLALVDPTGRLERLDVRVEPYLHPRVSPDGSQIAVQSFDPAERGIIWIYDVERRTQRQLTTQGSNVRPIWTPDGERITFESDRDGTWGIYWQRADGSDVAQRLTTAEPGMEHYPDSWHPDGQRLTFTKINPENTLEQSIWILDRTNGSEPTLFKEEISGSSAFSANGNWIAYRWTAGGPLAQLYVEPFPRTGAIYQITQDQGTSPVWSPLGNRLVYRRAVLQQQNQRSPLVAMEVTTGETFTFGNEQILPIEDFMTFFSYRDYDFMPNGEQLVMVFPADLDFTSARFTLRANVVLNWIEELRNRIQVP